MRDGRGTCRLLAERPVGGLAPQGGALEGQLRSESWRKGRGAYADRVRVVRLNDPAELTTASARSGDPVRISLAGGTEYTLTRSEFSSLDNGRQAWNAEMERPALLVQPDPQRAARPGPRRWLPSFCSPIPTAGTARSTRRRGYSTYARFQGDSMPWPGATGLTYPTTKATWVRPTRRLLPVTPGMNGVTAVVVALVQAPALAPVPALVIRTTRPMCSSPTPLPVVLWRSTMPRASRPSWISPRQRRTETSSAASPRPALTSYTLSPQPPGRGIREMI